jgi:hypothetical protein
MTAESLSDLPAVLSDDGDHRYWLHRHAPDRLLDQVYGRALFVMLNPSTADAAADDMTIRKCLGFSRALGATRAGVVNLFSRRSTDPTALRHVVERNGPEADEWVVAGLKWLRDGPGAKGNPSLIFAYGSPPWSGAGMSNPTMASVLLQDQAGRIAFVAREAAALGLAPMALGITADGWPRHPSRYGYAEANSNMQPVPAAHFRALGIGAEATE